MHTDEPQTDDCTRDDSRRGRSKSTVIDRARRDRLDLLARLLDDESAHTFDAVRTQLERAGRTARPALRRAARGESPRARGRARALLADLDRRPILRRVLGYMTRERVDLERGLLLIGRIADVRFDPRSSVRILDDLAHEVARRAREFTDPLKRVQCLVEVLGKTEGFTGGTTEFHRLDHVHLHRVLERRRGTPLALCAIYAAVARRAGLRVGILPFPGHVMLRLYGEATSVIVDPFHKGEARSERDCRKRLQAHGFGFQAQWFKDADARLLLRRQIGNLARSAETYGRKAELRDLRALLVALEKRPVTSAAAR